MEENKIQSSAPKPENKIVETYAEDMAKAIEGNTGALVKNLIHEEEAREAEKDNLSPESKKNKIFILVGAILLLVSVGTFAFLFLSKEVGTVEVEKEFTPMIFTDKTDFVAVDDLNKDQLSKNVLEAANSSEVKYGGVEALYLTLNEKVIGLRELISVIKGNLILPQVELVDNNFLLGVYSWETKSLFFLIKIRSMPDIFENMRAWEGKMFFDLHGPFGMDINADTRYLLTKDFDDAVVENKNARILHDQYGSIILMYVFVDDTHLVITKDLEAVREVITRLSGSRVKQ